MSKFLVLYCCKLTKQFEDVKLEIEMVILSLFFKRLIKKRISRLINNEIIATLLQGKDT